MARGLAILLILAFLGAAPVQAQIKEEKVPLEKVPRAVMEVLKKRFPMAKPIEATTEPDENNKMVFEVTLEEEGKKIDVILTPAGVITLIEKEIVASSLPRVVAAALESKYPKATYKIVEEGIKVKDGKETTDFYEVLLETADKKQRWEVKLATDGKILETEDKTKEKDDR
jgi:hypothetical protein